MRPTSGTTRRRNGTTLRALALPAPIEVRADEAGHPLALRSRRGRRTERVAQIRESWRIDDEWWRRPIHREYHQVTLEGGRMVTLYRDLTDGRWYEQTASPRTPRTTPGSAG